MNIGPMTRGCGKFGTLIRQWGKASINEILGTKEEDSRPKKPDRVGHAAFYQYGFLIPRCIFDLLRLAHVRQGGQSATSVVVIG
jgi:hypothetical protein